MVVFPGIPLLLKLVDKPVPSIQADTVKNFSVHRTCPSSVFD